MKKIITLILVFTATLLFSQVPNYVPTNGLVGYWPFTGNANDLSNNGNNGTVNGASLTADRNGNTNNAYYFSSTGCSTRIDAQVNTSSIQNGLTISIWVLRVGNGCQSPRILEFWPTNNPDGPGMAQWGWGNGNNTLGVGSITSTGFYCSAGIPVSGDNVWYNIVYTNDGNFGKFYKDGNLITTIPSTGNPILAGSVAFGRMNHPAFDNLNGKLDDIGVWNRALTQQEITNLYNSNLSSQEFVINDISIYPNPTTSLLNFKSTVQVEKILIYNMLGQLVQQEKGNALEGTINIEKLAQGTYLVKVNDIDKRYTIIKN